MHATLNEMRLVYTMSLYSLKLKYMQITIFCEKHDCLTTLGKMYTKKLKIETTLTMKIR